MTEDGTGTAADRRRGVGRQRKEVLGHKVVENMEKVRG